jgi:hypothetical protein
VATRTKKHLPKSDSLQDQIGISTNDFGSVLGFELELKPIVSIGISLFPPLVS